MQRLAQLASIPVWIEILEEELDMIQKAGGEAETPETRRRYTSLIARLQKERNRIRREYQLMNAYIDRIPNEEMRNMFIYRYRRRLPDPRTYRLIYGYNHPDPGSYIRHKICKQLNRSPLPFPSEDQEEKTDHDHLQRSKGSTAGGV